MIYPLDWNHTTTIDFVQQYKDNLWVAFINTLQYNDQDQHFYPYNVKKGSTV